MVQFSKIEWCHHTYNPWSGCTKVSPACKFCYAEALSKRMPKLGNWGVGAERKRASERYLNGPLRWNRQLDELALAGHNVERERVFCASLADWLDEEVPIGWLAHLLSVIERTPRLDWLLLTKRPGAWETRLEEVVESERCPRGDECVEAGCAHCFALAWLERSMPKNVWLGTTAEDQQRYDERIVELAKIPAVVRFLSMEPLLEGIDLGLNRNLPGERELRWRRPVKDFLHWVIVGGESGGGARPMHPLWATSLRDQCQAAEIPFFFKQWGAWAPIEHEEAGLRGGARLLPVASARGGAEVLMRANDDPATTVKLKRLTKKKTGRLLDGREWNEFPEVAA